MLNRTTTEVGLGTTRALHIVLEVILGILTRLTEEITIGRQHETLIILVDLRGTLLEEDQELALALVRALVINIAEVARMTVDRALETEDPLLAKKDPLKLLSNRRRKLK